MKINRNNITYEVYENGYLIKLHGRPWIKQTINNMPYPNLSPEECCIQHINDICEDNNRELTLQEQITNVELAIAEIYETLLG